MLGLSDGFERKSGVNPHHMNKIYPENAFYICYILSYGIKHFEPWSDRVVCDPGPYCLLDKTPKFISRLEQTPIALNGRLMSHGKGTWQGAILRQPPLHFFSNLI